MTAAHEVRLEKLTMPRSVRSTLATRSTVRSAVN